MTIIKRSGKKEEFSIDKIKRSLLRAGKDAGVTFSDNDMQRMTAELQQMFKDKEIVTTHQVSVVITGLLYVNGFMGILEYYASFKPPADAPTP